MSSINNKEIVTTDHSSNSAIRKKIYKVLGEESGINVHVYEGIVRLTGVVETEESLEFIESAVREVIGVDDVENELTVRIMQ